MNILLSLYIWKPTKIPTKRKTFTPCVILSSGSSCEDRLTWVSKRPSWGGWRGSENKKGRWIFKTIPVWSRTIVLLLLLLYCTTCVVRVLKSLTHAKTSRRRPTPSPSCCLRFFFYFHVVIISYCVFMFGFPPSSKFGRWSLIYLYLRCVCVCGCYLNAIYRPFFDGTFTSKNTPCACVPDDDIDTLR